MGRTLKITRIGIISATVHGFIIGAAAGFLLGIAGALWCAMFASVLTMASGLDLTGAGYVMLAVLPVGGMIAAGVAGMSAAFLSALLYNITAGVFGGVPVAVAESGEATKPNVMHSRRQYN